MGVIMKGRTSLGQHEDKTIFDKAPNAARMVAPSKEGAVKEAKHNEEHIMKDAAGFPHHSDIYSKQASGHTAHKEHVEKHFKGK